MGFKKSIDHYFYKCLIEQIRPILNMGHAICSVECLTEWKVEESMHDIINFSLFSDHGLQCYQMLHTPCTWIPAMMNCCLKVWGKINPFLLELYCTLFLGVTKLKKKTNTESCLPRIGEVVKINLSMRFIGVWNLSSVGMCKRLEFGARTVFKLYK